MCFRKRIKSDIYIDSDNLNTLLELDSRALDSRALDSRALDSRAVDLRVVESRPMG